MKSQEYMTYIKNFDTKAFQSALVDWFKQNKRDLPWRLDQDPYKVWVSEIMLQQTQVDTVIPFFNRFIEKFPTPTALAQAHQQDVLKAWEGLGYYSRARNLQSAVQEVQEKYQGKVPADREQLSRLKGIGPYTQGAIMSIAFNQPEPAVDGNVMRVLSRLLKIEADIAKARTKNGIEAIVREIISKDDPSSFNQGLMELGALICRPKNPDCFNCPVQDYCKAYKEDIQDQLPVKSTAKKQKTLHYYVFVIENNAGEILIEQRPETGLLAQLWQFPMIEPKNIDPDFIRPFVEEYFRVEASKVKMLEPVKHVFSHVIWQLSVFHIHVADLSEHADEQRLVTRDQLSEFPFPVSHQKVIQQLLDC